MSEQGESSVDGVRVVRTVTSHVAPDFVGTLGAETVERCVANSYDQLRSASRVTMHLGVLTEKSARERLRSVVNVEAVRLPVCPVVVFVCLHNAARSQMAAAWLRSWNGEMCTVSSAGTEPEEHVNAMVVDAMAEVAVDLSEEWPKPLTDEVVAAADVVVTMGCGEACPVLPGKRYEDWTSLLPVGPALPEVRAARDELRARVEDLARSLGLASR